MRDRNETPGGSPCCRPRTSAPMGAYGARTKTRPAAGTWPKSPLKRMTGLPTVGARFLRRTEGSVTRILGALTALLLVALVGACGGGEDDGRSGDSHALRINLGTEPPS